jgi:hypothetical protein
MAEQIGKIWIVRQLREASYALSADERAAKVAQADALRNECARVLVDANALWSGYGVASFGAELYPDIEALQHHTASLEKMDWFRYVDSETFVGTVQIANAPVYENPVFQLQFIRGLKELAWTLSPERVQSEQRRNAASAEALGVRRVLRLDTRWSREGYMWVQILEWPDMEALMKHIAFEEQQDWPRGVDQTHILGVKMS